MSADSPWVVFWSIVIAVGLAAYYLVLLGVVPLGARDIRRMFAKLDADGRDESEQRDDGGGRE